VRESYISFSFSLSPSHSYRCYLPCCFSWPLLWR
jgi:hypothetical protein